MTKLLEPRQWLLLVGSLLSLASIVLLVIATNGQIGSWLSNAMKHGDIPVSTNCDQVVIDGGMPTRIMAADMATFVAPNAWNVLQLQEAAVERFGETIQRGEMIKVCGSVDGYQIATLNDVNLGR